MRYLLSLFCLLFLLGCNRTLPFPTPSQQNLVVLTTSGPLTYSIDENGNASGLEHDLAEAFAQELGVDIEFIVAPADEIAGRLAAGEGHLAIGWLPPLAPGSVLKSTDPIMQSHDVIIQHEASLPLDEMSDLRGKTVHVLSPSRQLETLKLLKKKIASMKIIEHPSDDIYPLLEDIDNRKIEYAAIDSSLIDIAMQYVPSLQASLELSKDEAIVWWLGANPNPELFEKARVFVEQAQHDGTLARIEDRYFGHVRRLKQADIIKYLERIGSLLPKFRQHFIAAQKISGLDWRLIAAVAYHESQWDPNATSPTGVRGIMMLTEETADRLDVSNRLNPRESILAGASYINTLRNLQSDDVPEPDRTWLALAAYNIGPGHFNAGRALAKLQGADPRSWYEMKRVLPLLAQAKHAKRVKSGRARGGEAVILVENIRSYYDILVRHEPVHTPRNEKKEKKQDNRGLKMGSAPGLKLKH